MKGSGKAYNSRLGQGVLIGTESGKILSYEHHKLVIANSEVSKITGRVKDHDCRMNWGSSSKAMESGWAVDMLISGATKGSHINNYHG